MYHGLRVPRPTPLELKVVGLSGQRSRLREPEGPAVQEPRYLKTPVLKKTRPTLPSA